MNTPATTEPPKDLVGFLDFYLVKKAPFQIPDGGAGIDREVRAVDNGRPADSTLPLLLFALGIGAIFIPFGGIGYASRLRRPDYFRHHRNRPDDRRAAWTVRAEDGGMALLFYSQLVSIVYNVLSGNVVGGLLFGLICALHPVSGEDAVLSSSRT